MPDLAALDKTTLYNWYLRARDAANTLVDEYERVLTANPDHVLPDDETRLTALRDSLDSVASSLAQAVNYSGEVLPQLPAGTIAGAWPSVIDGVATAGMFGPIWSMVSVAKGAAQALVDWYARVGGSPSDMARSAWSAVSAVESAASAVSGGAVATIKNRLLWLGGGVILGVVAVALLRR